MHADGILLDDTVWVFFFFPFFFSPEHRMCVYVGGGAGVCVCVGIIHFSALLLFEIIGHTPH